MERAIAVMRHCHSVTKPIPTFTKYAAYQKTVTELPLALVNNRSIMAKLLPQLLFFI